MDNNLVSLQKIMPLIAKVVDGGSLTATEAEQVFTNIFLYDTEGYHLAIFMGAIHAKGETSDELLGFYNTTKALANKIDIGLSPDKAIDLSGTGGGSFKTINVSTAASFVVAAAGYTVAKEAYYAVTSPTGSADVFLAFGIDIAKLDEKALCNALKQTQISPMFTPFISPKLINRGQISRKLFGERQLAVRSPFHLVSNVFSPLHMSYRLYGCYSEKYLDVLGQLFVKIGFKKSLVMYGKIGIPEFSNIGETIVVEQEGQKIRRYTVTAKDFGAKEAKEKDILSNGKEQNIIDFIRILKGKEQGAKADLVAINAAAALYILGDVKDFKEGYKKAIAILHNGKAYSILEKLTQIIGLPSELKKWEARI